MKELKPSAGGLLRLLFYSTPSTFSPGENKKTKMLKAKMAIFLNSEGHCFVFRFVKDKLALLHPSVNSSIPEQFSCHYLNN